MAVSKAVVEMIAHVKLEQECLKAFNNLLPTDQHKFIARMEQRYEDYTPEQKRKCILICAYT